MNGIVVSLATIGLTVLDSRSLGVNVRALSYNPAERRSELICSKIDTASRAAAVRLGAVSMRRVIDTGASAEPGIHGGIPESPQGYIGFVEQLPGANTQGATLEEARTNLASDVIRERLTVTA
jgi:hypothetical protein